MILQKDVMIALKNGQTKYGLLLNREIHQENESWNFIDYSNIKSYSKTKNKLLIEVFEKSEIKFIDLSMK